MSAFFLLKPKSATAIPRLGLLTIPDLLPSVMGVLSQLAMAVALSMVCSIVTRLVLGLCISEHRTNQLTKDFNRKYDGEPSIAVCGELFARV